MVSAVMSGSGQALVVDNARLSQLFVRYERQLDAFIVALTHQEWSDADDHAEELIALGKELMWLGRGEQNSTWEYYASNLVHHGQELQDACWKQDSREAIYLVSTLINHLGEIQAAVPVWLLDHLEKQVHTLEDAMANRDRRAIRDAAEVIHSAAHKIILSASTSRQSYRHTRWLTNLLEINRLGDLLVGDAPGEDWAAYEGYLRRIQSIFVTWKDGFHPALIARQP
ncbi:MAG: hypothetical protein G8237_06430 [Magnetococcales bacterium]|nr:hypothetical protein [Magnetococcales bacterium]